MQTLISAIFFVAALALLLATVLAPVYLLSKTLQQLYPAFFPWPAWRWTLTAFLLAIPYCLWRQSFDDIWRLTQDLLIGSFGSACLLLALVAGWRWWHLRMRG